MTACKILAFVTTAICVSLSSVAQESSPTNCNYYSVNLGPFPYGSLDYQEHSSGAHQMANGMTGSCNYTGSAVPGITTKCTVTASAGSSTAVGEDGSLSNPLKVHQTGVKDHQGMASSTGGLAASADAEGVVGIESCIGLCGGALQISINGDGVGGGFTWTFQPPNPLWSDSKHYPILCAGESLPPLQCTPSGPPPYAPSEGYTWEWDSSSCTYIQVPTQVSPIIIDTKNVGFHFTDPAKGQYVTFDMRGDGKYEKVSWPKVSSGNAWLVLDRDGDGIIQNGTELFGDFTPHSDGGVPNHPNPTGFLALDWYDQPGQGGNMDLIIDKRDAIWPKLKLWIDAHCYQTPDTPCQSRPEELHTLESLGVNSLSLVYKPDRKTDAIGNEFKFSAVVNPDAETTPKDAHGNVCCDLHLSSHDGRLAYDVYLKQAQ